MSVAVKLSLTSTAYALGFLTNGWTVARDVANMAFLFIVIFLAFSIILRADTSGTTQTLALIIVMALLVNFSFFLARVVIDAGNIAAVQVYNVIPAPKVTDTSTDASGNTVSAYGCGVGTAVTGGTFICDTGMKDLTSVIMAGLNLQNLYSSDAFKNWAARPGNGFFTQTLTLVALYIATAILLAILGFMFLAAGAKFLTRIVALWLLIIASPLAFAAFALPQTKQYFTKWRSLVLTNTIYPAVFLFMFLMVTIFMKQACNSPANTVTSGGNTAQGATQCLGILGNIFSSGSATPDLGFATGLGINLTAVAIVMGLVIIMVFMAMKVADKVAVSGASLTAKLPGWVAGRYAGAIGFAGRRTIGYAGAAAARSERLRDSGAVGNALWRLGGRASKASFDLRAAPVGGTIASRYGLGAAKGQGGVESSIQRRQQRLVERGKAVLDTDAQKEARLQKYNEEFLLTKGKSFDQAIAEEKGKENAANKESEILRDKISKLQVKRASQNGKLDATDAAGLRDLEEKRRLKADEIRAAQKQAGDWMKDRTQKVERVQENRERLEKFMKEGPLLSTNMPGTNEALGQLRKLLPEMAPIPPAGGPTPPPTGTAGGVPATPGTGAGATATTTTTAGAGTTPGAAPAGAGVIPATGAAAAVMSEARTPTPPRTAEETEADVAAAVMGGSRPTPLARATTPVTTPVPSHELVSAPATSEIHPGIETLSTIERALSDMMRKAGTASAPAIASGAAGAEQLRSVQTTQNIASALTELKNIRSSVEKGANINEEIKKLQGDSKVLAQTAIKQSKENIAKSLAGTKEAIEANAASAHLDRDAIQVNLDRQKVAHENNYNQHDTADKLLQTPEALGAIKKGIKTELGTPPAARRGVTPESERPTDYEEGYRIEKMNVTSSGIQPPPSPGIIGGGRTIPEPGPEPHDSFGGHGSSAGDTR